MIHVVVNKWVGKWQVDWSRMVNDMIIRMANTVISAFIWLMNDQRVVND